MTWDTKRFEELIRQIRSSLKGRPTSAGVPFFIYVYNPQEERICIRNFENLARRFENEGFCIQLVYLGRVLIQALRETPYLTPRGLEVERESRDDLRRELSRILPQKIADILLNGREGIVESLKGEEAKGKGAFLLRAGALFPFVHISQILAHLENKTRQTIVVPFPGSIDPSHTERLRFLNETVGTYYRAVVI